MVATTANAPDRDAASDLLASHSKEKDKPEVLGDSAYAYGVTRDTLLKKGFKVIAKCPPVRNATGLFTKDLFVVDLQARTVTCPAGQSVIINPTRQGGGRASFKVHCSTCPMRSACTKSRSGRSITIHKYENLLQQARAEQREPDWAKHYRANRPIVERKIAHFVRRPWAASWPHPRTEQDHH